MSDILMRRMTDKMIQTIGIMQNIIPVPIHSFLKKAVAVGIWQMKQ